MAGARATPRELVAELLRSTTCYDALPHSGKVVVFDVGLPVRLAFFALVEHECTAAPLWDSARGCFAGMVTVTDFIQMMLQYHRAGAAADALSGNTLAAWKAEQARRLAEHTQRPPSDTAARAAAVAGAVPLEVTAAGIAGSASAPFPFPAGLVQVRPDASLLDACRLLRRHRIHRVAVVPRETDWARGDASAVCDAATAASKDSVRRVVDAFAATRVSRLVGVDAEGRPVGVITLADVFQYFTDAAGGDDAAREGEGGRQGARRGEGASSAGEAGETSIGLTALSDGGKNSPEQDDDDDDDDDVDMG